LDSDGRLHGTPTAANSFTFTITATDSAENTGSQAYTVNVDEPVLTLLPETLPNGMVGTPYSATFSAFNGEAPYTYFVSDGTLPDGLTLDDESGILSGTPTAAGGFSFTVTAADGDDQTVERAYTLIINAPTIVVSPETLPNGQLNVPYNQTISASGGTAPYTFAVTGGTLPDGLMLETDGTLHGTPTATGSFGFTITASDANESSGGRVYSITVTPELLAINPPTLPDGIVGTPYSQTLIFSGGEPPYTVSQSGTLPDGLTFNTGTGEISGTPTTAGTFNFSVTLEDATRSVTNNYEVTIHEVGTILLAPETLPNGEVGVGYSQTISATGGTAPYAFAVTAGALPDGLTLASDGELTGTPTASGTFSFTITATDDNEQTGERAYTVTVSEDVVPDIIVVSPAALPNGTVNTAYSQTISASGGAAPYTFAVTVGALPDGLTLASNGTLSGTPTANGSFSFTVIATDSVGNTGSRSYTLVIDAGVQLPPPPPTPLCEEHNFDEGGVVRSSTSDANGYAINCRVLYQNGAPTQWLGADLYNGGSIGIEGIFELGVQQAVDIFSPAGMNYFEGGAVFCLRGSGYLIWLAASGQPRVPKIIGSYTVPEFPGFTCATLFEPGTLVLVSVNPVR
ncbi:MAG: Ig domain-containing protein, partial [Chloroflexota bacterium]